MIRPPWLTKAWWAARWRPGSNRERWSDAWLRLKSWREWKQIRTRCRWLRRFPLRKARQAAGDWLFPPDIDKQEWFIDEDKWALDYFPPREDDSYRITLEYAEKRYKACLDLSADLDKKLDDLVRTAATVGTIIATVMRFLGTDNPFRDSKLLIPSLICFGVTVLVAAWSRRPTKIRTPAKIRGVLVVTDKPSYIKGTGEQIWGYLSEGKIKALLTSSFHLAEVGTNEVNEWKAKQLRRATIFFCVGVVLLFLMLITSSSRPASGQGSGQPSPVNQIAVP